MAPAANPWPTVKNGPVQRHGQMLRAYGASLKSRAESDSEVRKALEAWLWRLPLGDNLQERRRRIETALGLARPVPAPVPDDGFSSMIELELPLLQRALGTYYE